MSKQRQPRPAAAERDHDGERDGARALDRDFGEAAGAATVLVELYPTSLELTAPSSGMFASVVQDKVLKRIEDAAGRAVRPVFGETVRARDRVGMVTSYAAGPSPAAAPRGATPLALYHELEAASTSEALEVAKKLRQQVKDVVAAANPVPVAMPAIGPPGAESTSETPPTPDFRVLQGYRGPGPAGFGFDLAWHLPGGTGEGVIVVDLEGGWRITHEALSAVNFGLLSGVNREESGWRQHGTAVAGMLSSETEQVEGGGIFGLCAGARVCPLSLYVEPDRPRDRLAQQIVASLQILRPGGVLLVELQRPGPATDFEACGCQFPIPFSGWCYVGRSARNSQLAHLVLQRCAFKSQELRCAALSRDFPVRGFERLHNRLALCFLKGRAGCADGRGSLQFLQWDPELAALRQYHRSFNEVFQFADIAGPGCIG